MRMLPLWKLHNPSAAARRLLLQPSAPLPACLLSSQGLPTWRALLHQVAS